MASSGANATKSPRRVLIVDDDKDAVRILGDFLEARGFVTTPAHDGHEALARFHDDGPFDVVLGSRILGGAARRGGMPPYKYIANRALTALQNLLCNAKLSEYHTGYRAFTREVLEQLPLLENSNDFVFDNQMLAQVLYHGFEIGEISCPAAYFEEASSINFRRSIQYGLGVVATSLQFRLQRWGWGSFPQFAAGGRGLQIAPPEESPPASASDAKRGDD